MATKPDSWVGVTLMVVFVCLIVFSAIGEYRSSKHIGRLNDVMGHMFKDYCSTKGGVIPMFSIEVYLDEIDTSTDTSYLTCADDPDAGILVVQGDSAVYYIPEGK